MAYTFNGRNNACTNLINVAANAKAQGILVIMLGYNLAGKRCNDYDGDCHVSCSQRHQEVQDGLPATTTTTTTKTSSSPAVLDVMAQAASPTAIVDGVGGDPSVADSDCSDTAEQTSENSDGDFFFCAASGTEMAPIFRTALSPASGPSS